ncbi:MAG: hypothetical protein ACYC6Z_04760 [Thermoleophilia bacterium]
MEGKVNTPVSSTGASEEQKRYAAVLGAMMKIGFVLLVITFILYLIGVPKPHVPVGDVSQFWGLKGEKYLEAIGVEKGWSWVERLGEGDFLNFAPVALLASITALCYLAIIPIFIKKKDMVYALLASLEIIILVLAASGVIPSGGH